MCTTRLLFVTVFVLGSAVGAAPARAELPSIDLGPPCTALDLEADPPAGDVPANWPVFAFVAGGGSRVDWSAVRLVRVRDGAVVPTAILGVVALLENLTPGEDYDLYHPTCPFETQRSTRYRAVAPIAEPPSLGTIEVSELYAANHEQGAANRFYFVEVSLTPDPGFALEPWMTSMSWSVEIDGDSRVVSSEAMSTPRTRVGVYCTPSFGITTGPHVFRGIAFAVRDGVRFTTPDVASTVGPCATALRVDAVTLLPLTLEEIAYWDQPPMDAGVPSMDAGASPDGGVDGGRMGMHTERDTDSNCSMGSGRRGSLGPAAALMIVLLMLARTRRR